ncbi:ImmA/IrrE family metallo-endopeptidase [Mesorhizobium sp. CA14]|uniref:ImmA/IrrE family metallo-endopeptidase n=1 Tax=Mesorhizobium sp. CA14 TaxID=2876642 RepID=UPI001CCA8DB2|nr:ImmA/IrrE family metallo-endopeptidase [Mesorhizobium sp. CA14]MBZ9850589.1 ImmA/IrrE family metallo-endopeptidase [Mesorhizobium sp. CA14]
MKSLDRFNPESLNELEIAERAHQFRATFGIADKTYVDIIEILEFRIIDFVPDFRLIIRRDIELKNTAETTIDPPRIFVRETIYDAACEGDRDCRRILAHELGHFLLHMKIEGSMQRNLLGYEKQILASNSLSSIEDQADIFARHFLVPPYVAFKNREDIQNLADLTGVPQNIAAAAATISKRVEMLKIRDYQASK